MLDEMFLLQLNNFVEKSVKYWPFITIKTLLHNVWLWLFISCLQISGHRSSSSSEHLIIYYLLALTQSNKIPVVYLDWVHLQPVSLLHKHATKTTVSHHLFGQKSLPALLTWILFNKERPIIKWWARQVNKVMSLTTQFVPMDLLQDTITTAGDFGLWWWRHKPRYDLLVKSVYEGLW